MTIQEPDRQSIWSVATAWLPIYFALFDALGLLGVSFVIARNGNRPACGGRGKTAGNPV